MNNLKSIFGIALLVGAVTLTSCNKNQDVDNTPSINPLAKEVVGSYTGTVTNSLSNKTEPATMTVTSTNDTTVSLHCVSNNFDSTITLKLYENSNQLMVCYVNQDFYNEYGKYPNDNDFCNSKSQGWDNGWCNGNNCWGGNDNWNAWTNHKNTQHSSTDMHYGGFNLDNNSCNYEFVVTNDTVAYSVSFSGNL